MPADFSHWQAQHGPVVTLMVAFAVIGVIACVVLAIYLNRRERQDRDRRREETRLRRSRDKKHRRR